MISVVMAYHNRIHLLRYTLETINKCQEKNYEIVIVDDFSNDDHSLKNIENEFPDIKFQIIDMKNEVSEKWYRNPCIPFNIGFRKSRGEKIIIQNPECCHIGNLIESTRNNLNDSNYLSFHCYATGPNDTKSLHKGKRIEYNNKPLKQSRNDESKWYNHASYRPASYNFATAITRNNLIKLNGFDERFALGHNCDDDDFIARVRRMNLRIDFVSDPHVIHQHHGVGVSTLATQPLANNREIWDKLKYSDYIVAPNKINLA